MKKVNVTLCAIALAWALPAFGADAGPGDTTYVFLRGPLPGTPASCPAAVTAPDGLLKAPLFGAESVNCPVASVDGDVVTLDELNEALAAAHQSHRSATHAGKKDASVILDRIVDARLVVAEARTMGIDEIPEVKKQLEDLRAATGFEVLQGRVLRVVKPDPKEVERLYRDAVREWKLDSVLFVREADAKEMAAAVRKGGDFDALAKAAVASGKARGSDRGGQFVKSSQLVPPILGAVEKLKQGGVSAPVKLENGFALVQVEAIRYPDDPKARADAEAASLAVQKKKALKAYYGGIEKKYAQIDRALLKKLDFDAAKPGLEALKKDKRVVARVQGTPPITVGDLAQRLEVQFFHGAAEQAKKKKLNQAKQDTIDAIVSPRVVAIEVAKERIPETEEFRRRLATVTTGYLFGQFVERIIFPDTSVSEAEAEKYYKAHQADYAYPGFYKLESIGFLKAKDAEAAVAKLRAGTDFKWLNANADGKIPDGKTVDKVEGVISVKAMPASLSRTLEGAKAGDYRVYAGSADQFFAVHVVEVIPPSFAPYQEVRGEIGQKLLGEAIQKAVESYIAKLRKAHPPQVFLVRIGA